MAQENVEIARRVFDAYSQGGIEAMLAYFTPDCVFYPDPSWIEERVYRGRDAFAAFNRTQTEAFGNIVVEIHEIRAVGERVLALTELVGQAPASGVPIRQEVAHVFSDFREGMISEDRTFLNWDEALKAVGLEE
jgi:ketosteroid isomerase-like protein